MAGQVLDQRGIAKQVKQFLPRSFARPIARVAYFFAGFIPYRLKYSLGTWLRRGTIPYSLLSDGDVVVQVGSPRDLVAAGRSRAVHFARLVGTGKVVVIEPDADNADYLRRFIARHRLDSTIMIVECGAWREPGEMRFLCSSNQPATSQLAVVPRYASQDGLVETIVPVDTIDSILEQLGLTNPKLVSITTNGAELQILEGMPRTIGRGCRYIGIAASLERYHRALDMLGFDHLARDDRGACYRRRSQN